MIISNVRDEPFYKDEIIEFLMMRDKDLFVNNPHNQIYDEDTYAEIVEDLKFIFDSVDLPKEDIYSIVKQILEKLYNLYYDDEYKHYKGIKLHNGTSPKKKINRDIESHIKPYEELLEKLYGEYIHSNDEQKVFINAPEEVKEHFRLLNRLKDNMQKDGTFENKQYYKPKGTTKKSIKQLFKDIEAHYKISFNKKLLEELNSKI